MHLNRGKQNAHLQILVIMSDMEMQYLLLARAELGALEVVKLAMSVHLDISVRLLYLLKCLNVLLEHIIPNTIK